MSGRYYGRDGPCVPWNDALLRRYVLEIYALDLYRLDAITPSSGPRSLGALKDHVIDSASIIGTSVACASFERRCRSYSSPPRPARSPPCIQGGLIPIFFHLTNQNDEPTFTGT